jgi:hypothetical protein
MSALNRKRRAASDWDEVLRELVDDDDRCQQHHQAHNNNAATPVAFPLTSSLASGRPW